MVMCSLQAFLESHPHTARINERASVLLDFPDFPCPSLSRCAAASSIAPSAGAPAAARESAAACLQSSTHTKFHLLAQPSASGTGGARWQHLLLSSSSDSLGMPAQV